ncbi:Pre-mRNA-processing factor 6 [Smittium mucronatum]|uniref:Pre-mRNA-processing factor 6 n=1 Tax=Smittium mucronatum TaxID=133383 RepID=A0A1R0GQB0_9FUNG|nr:Pre-mRNA-processing factor 6 [Smittium mucronatum]
MAKSLLSRAVKECPKSGILWSEYIIRESRPQRKARSVDALKNCDNNDPIIVSTIARLFWSERKIDKARSWFERACKLDPSYGDGWAWWLKFELEMYALESKVVESSSSGSNKISGNKIELNRDGGLKPISSDLKGGLHSNGENSTSNQDEPKIYEKVIDSAVLASPHLGEMWVKVAKDPKNYSLSVKEILELVVSSLPPPMPY